MSFEFRGTPPPTASPLLKPVPSPIVQPMPPHSEWQKVHQQPHPALDLFIIHTVFARSPPLAQPFTAPVLPVSASPLMQPVSSPVIAALAGQSFSAGGPPVFSLSSSTLPSSSRGGGGALQSQSLPPAGLPPLPPSKGFLHKASPSNVASNACHGYDTATQ